jgi:hypothetical protein
MSALSVSRVISGVVPADCPEDGGKWAIYCEHIDADGEVIGTGVVQDTNKRRLSTWEKHTLDWCCYCQEERDAAIVDRDALLIALDDVVTAALGIDCPLSDHTALKSRLLAVVDGRA